jgi:hypothetical protein
MRIGRLITAGTLGMGAYRAYQQYKGRDDTSVKGRSRFGGLRGRDDRGRRRR